MQKDKNIYLVEDEVALADTISRTLTDFGYKVSSFSNGTTALKALEKCRPDLCLVDLYLPDMDGLEIVKMLEDCPSTGVMIITGRGELSDRVLGLEFGADDYLVKPFEPRELVARVKSLLRRIDKLKSQMAAVQVTQKAVFADWAFDTTTFRLHAEDGRQEVLSSVEAQLLLTFLNSPNRILSREQLMDERDDIDFQPYDRSIDLRVSRLRKKLELNPKEPKILKTVYGAGYLFSAQISWVEE